MTKQRKAFVSILLATVMLFSMGTTASAASNSAIVVATNALTTIINIAFKALTSTFPKQGIPDVEDYDASELKAGFYEGNGTFLDEPAENAVWSLGFGMRSIVPEDLLNGKKKYYTGGYFTQQIDSVYDDQRVHAIAMNDGSGRGTSVFASIDGIGTGNADIRAIRLLAEEKLAERGIDSDLVSININATHCHTVIDTQGISLMLIAQVLHNIGAKYAPFLDPIRSIDSTFYDVMIEGAAEAIVEAYVNMETGSLYYCETAGVAKDTEKGVYTQDDFSYIFNKRYDTEGFQNFFACFKFVPDNSASKATVFVNIGAHPTTIDRATSKLSADFPVYIEKKLNEQGMNFMFIQGAQAPISVRKGAVVNAEVEAEIAQDEVHTEYRSAKSLGYEFARLISEACENAVAVEPMLNVKMAECKVMLDPGLLQLGAASQLLGFTTVSDSASDSGYSIITEVGYVEIGKDIVLLTVPGELVPQLVFGDVIDANESYLGTAWELPCTADLIGEDKTVLVMGLCNDAIGYIVPDNDYAPFIADTIWNTDLGEKVFGKYRRHYEELLTTGGTAATSVMGALNELVESN